MKQLLGQILLSLSFIATGAALRCYHCLPNSNLTSAGKPSCLPEPITCKNATHCLSMRRRTPQNPEWTYKSCAGGSRCVSAHKVCIKLSNSSRDIHCHAHCCVTDLCNLEVHTNKAHYTGVSSVLVPLNASMTSLWLMLIHLCALT